MALAKLYKVTGDEKYLNTAKYFVEETGRGTDGHRLERNTRRTTSPSSPRMKSWVTQCARATSIREWPM